MVLNKANNITKQLKKNLIKKIKFQYKNKKYHNNQRKNKKIKQQNKVKKRKKIDLFHIETIIHIYAQ